MVTARFCTKWMVLLVSIFLLSACGGDDTTTTATGTSEGTATSPSSITLSINTETPHSGTVGNKSVGKSYYTATGLTLGTTYTITLYGLSADADLEVYSDLPFDFIDGPVCTSEEGGTTIERCKVRANSDQMNIAVDGSDTLSGATYSISVNGPDTAITPSPCTSPDCFNFEDVLFPASFIHVTGNGADWFLDTTAANAANGSYSIRSGVITHSQTSCFSYTPTTATSYVSFNRRVDSEQYKDLLLFYIDDVLQTPVWYGSIIWQRVTFNTVSATHTYKWCYSKNSTVSIGADLARLDDILIR